MYNFNPMIDIDRRIEDLQRLKSSYQAPQQPINIYNNTTSPQNDFKAVYLNENEKVDEILVNAKTAFIDLKNGQLSIKDVNGEITSFELVIPKTPEQLKIEELERKVKEYEQLINANNEVGESDSNATKPSKVKSTNSTSYSRSSTNNE